MDAALREIEEGGLTLRVPPRQGDVVSARMPTFYNPAMRTSRDIGTACAAAFLARRPPQRKGCDLLAATGVRGLRYLSTGTLDELCMNDLRRTSFELMFTNLKLNFQVRVLSSSPSRIRCLAGSSKVLINRDDAQHFLSDNKFAFDLLDVDPFGSPVPFIPQSLLSVRHGGLLCVTATDTAALCGTYPKTCLRRYGSYVVKTDYMHEVGLRILIAYIARTAASLDTGIRPILSHATGHYYRVYLEVERSKRAAQSALENVGWAAHCRRCLSRTTIPFPPQRLMCCGEPMSLIGPLWIGDMKDQRFVESVVSWIAQRPDMGQESLRIIRVIREEEEIFSYFDLHHVSRKLGLPAPRTAEIIERLREMGFRVSATHITGTGVRTDAPGPTLRTLVRDLVRGCS